MNSQNSNNPMVVNNISNINVTVANGSLPLNNNNMHSADAMYRNINNCIIEPMDMSIKKDFFSLSSPSTTTVAAGPVGAEAEIENIDELLLMSELVDLEGTF